MLLSEALTKLKNLKSKASRTEEYINSCATHYEGDVPEYSYEIEMFNRVQLNTQILELKASIQETNAQTLVQYKGQTMSLAKVILLNAALRAELAFLAQQSNHKINEKTYRSERTTNSLKEVFAPGCDKQKFKIDIDRLESEKEEIEAVMANANAVTQLR